MNARTKRNKTRKGKGKQATARNRQPRKSVRRNFTNAISTASTKGSRVRERGQVYIGAVTASAVDARTVVEELHPLNFVDTRLGTQFTLYELWEVNGGTIRYEPTTTITSTGCIFAYLEPNVHAEPPTTTTGSFLENTCGTSFPVTERGRIPVPNDARPPFSTLVPTSGPLNICTPFTLTYGVVGCDVAAGTTIGHLFWDYDITFLMPQRPLVPWIAQNPISISVANPVAFQSSDVRDSDAEWPDANASIGEGRYIASKLGYSVGGAGPTLALQTSAGGSIRIGQWVRYSHPKQVFDDDANDLIVESDFSRVGTVMGPAGHVLKWYAAGAAIMDFASTLRAYYTT